MTEGRFAMLTRSDPERAEVLLAEAQADVDERWRYYEQLAGRRAHDRRTPGGARRTRMTDLTTHYLGLRLRSPIVASGSPVTGDLDGLLALDEAGAGAVVLPSLFEEQIEHEALEIDRMLATGAGGLRRGGGLLPGAGHLQHRAGPLPGPGDPGQGRAVRARHRQPQRRDQRGLGALRPDVGRRGGRRPRAQRQPGRHRRRGAGGPRRGRAGGHGGPGGRCGGGAGGSQARAVLVVVARAGPPPERRRGRGAGAVQPALRTGPRPGHAVRRADVDPQRARRPAPPAALGGPAGGPDRRRAWP